MKCRTHSPENNEVSYQQGGRMGSVKDTRSSEISLTFESISLSSMLKKEIKSIRAGTGLWKQGDP